MKRGPAALSPGRKRGEEGEVNRERPKSSMGDSKRENGKEL